MAILHTMQNRAFQIPRRISHNVRGKLFILVAAVMWSSSGVFATAPAFQNWPPEQRGPIFAFWRAAFAGLVLMPMVRRPRWNIRLVPMTLTFSAMNVSFLTAMTLSTPANAVWLQNTAPVWVFIAGALWLKEAVKPRDWLMLLFCMAGVGTILTTELRGQASSGTMFGLASSLFYAGVILSVRLLRGFDAVWLIALNHLVAAIVLAPYAYSIGVWPTPSQLIVLAAFGVFQMGLPYVLFSIGVRTVESHEASGIVLLEPVLVPLWVYLCWHTQPSYMPPTKWTLLGGGLILVGLLVRYVGGRRRAIRVENTAAEPIERS